ncbi:MAG: hypothetical protein WCV93_00210 [Candidatus Shapirobacteria bacterium]|jgi:hypothetical protein
MNNIIIAGLILFLFAFLLTIVIKRNNSALKSSNSTVIIVLGLGDNRESKVVTYLWKEQRIKVVFFQTNWKSDENYQDKLNRLLVLIDREAKLNRVSLVGTSAGGSMVINAYALRKNTVNKMVTVCSRLKKGQIKGFRGFEERTKGYPAFRDSVILAEEVEKSFSENDRQKIMTVHSLLGDELVPTNTAIIDGAKNIVVPLGEHMVSIASSLTIFSKPLVEFMVSN